MACSLIIRDDVSVLVIPIYQAGNNFVKVKEETPLGDDADGEIGLGLNEDAQRGYIGPVRKAVENAGCSLSNDIGPDDFVQDTVADVINRVCDDLGITI